eukprot:2261199-Amphidinium_carterae.1
MSGLFMRANRFAGTLPNRAVAGLGALSVSNNDFEGKLSHTHSVKSLIYSKFKDNLQVILYQVQYPHH